MFYFLIIGNTKRLQNRVNVRSLVRIILKNINEIFQRNKIFLITAILTVLVDYMVYFLSRKLIINTSQAKAFGVISGTFFAVLANRNITFRNHNNIWGCLNKFLILYSGTLIISVIINNTLLNWLSDFLSL
jgi:putative flippase GtrA